MLRASRVWRVLSVRRVPSVLPDRRVRKANSVPQGRRAILARLVLGALSAPRATPAPQEIPALAEPRATPARPDPLARQVLSVTLVLPETRDLLAQRVTLVLRETPGLRATPGLQVRLVPQATPVRASSSPALSRTQRRYLLVRLLVTCGSPATTDTLMCPMGLAPGPTSVSCRVLLARLVLREQRVRRATRATRVLRALSEPLVLLVLRERRGPLVLQAGSASRDLSAFRVRSVPQATPVPEDSLGLPGRPETRALVVLRESRATQATPDLPGTRGLLASRASKVSSDHKDRPGLLRRSRSAPLLREP